MANKKISDYADASLPLDGTELFELETVGGLSRKATAQDIADLGSGGGGAVTSVNGQTGVVVLDASDVGAGDVSGPATSVDNTLARYDGTGGDTLQGSGVAVTDNDEISGYRGHLNTQTGTTYTLVAGDSGKVVELVNAAAITLTLPNNLAVGFCCTIVQGGAGQVTLAAASGASIRNRQSHTKIAGQWGGATLYVRSNTGGSSAEYVLAGDTAT